MSNKLFNFLLTSLFLLFIFYITGISDFLLYEKLPDRMGATLGKVGDYDGIKFYFHILIPVLIIFTLLYSFSYDKLNNFFIRYKKLLLFTFVFLSLLSFFLIIFRNWHFQTDDKWVYYRTSLNVLEYFLPYWNPGDRVNVQASAIWPYFSSIGHIFGSWELFTNSWSLLMVFLISLFFYVSIEDKRYALIGFSSILLFFPMILWAMGGQETTTNVLLLLLVSFYFLKNKKIPYLVWISLGAFMWLRPDCILIGAGAFSLYFLFDKNDDYKRKIKCGISFAAPILVYLAWNIYFFDKPFPTPYYVKGLNKVFSGIYPMYYDIYIGSIHFLSALAVIPVAALSIFYLIRFLSFNLFSKNLSLNMDLVKSPVVWLISGCLAHVFYVILMGYQHMNFSFRYQIPSIILLFWFSLILLSQSYNLNFISKKLKEKFIKSLSKISIMNIPLGLLIGFYAASIDLTLTRAPLRDLFSTDAYTSYVRSWLNAGEYMKANFKKEDKIFLFQNLAGASLIESYAIDQFYFPITTSRFKELKDAWNKYHNDYLYEHFEYILSFPDREFNKNFLLHDEHKVFGLPKNESQETLIILKRKDNWQDILEESYNIKINN